MSRFPRLLAPLLAILVVGCTVEEGEAPEPSPTQTTLPGVDLAYAFETGSVLVYEVDLHQDLTFETQGEVAAVVDDDLPASADVTIEATGELAFTVSDGPEDGTYRLDVEGDFDDVTVTGTADGEEVTDPADVEQFGTIQPIANSMVVDSRGRVVAEGPELPSPAAPLSGLTGDLGGFFGPVLPEGPVFEGQSWTETYAAQVLGEEAAERTVTGGFSREESERLEVVVVETESVTEGAEVDLTAFFEEFLLALAEDAVDDTATVDPDQVAFRITIEPTDSEGTAHLDASRGLVVNSISTGSTSLQMDVALPDQDTGDIQEFVIHLETRQTIEYSLVEGPDD